MDFAHLPPREIERIARLIPPGGWGVENTRPLSTLLGSCVAVCMYDGEMGIGGMNHFMLPVMQRRNNSDVDALLAGDYCMEALLNALMKRGARRGRLRAKAFGGGTIIEALGQKALTIGKRNADFTQEWLDREGIPLVAADFLGPWSRKLLFIPATGDAYCRKMVTSMATEELIAKEQAYARSLSQQPPSPPEKKIELF